ncbi:MAG: C39 family peptidase [Patescibacteria group bacterium]
MKYDIAIKEAKAAQRLELGFFVFCFVLVSFYGVVFLARPASAAAKTILLKVPFTSQAPLGQWQDERQQDGCEEAAALMALAWLKPTSAVNKLGRTLTKKEWQDKIINLSNWEEKKYGEYRDVSLGDIRDWIFKDYFSYSSTTVKKVASASDIIKELEKGNLVLTPMNGRALKNPYFTYPGPERHMILIKGYDYKTKQFITNDPGTRRGENYRYSALTIFKAIRPYQTGSKVAFVKLVKEMLVISR